MKHLLLISSILVASQFSFAEANPVIEMTDARIFAPLKGSNATGGYVTLKNITKSPAVIMIRKAKSFKAVEMHETIEKDGRMAMQKVEQLTIAAGQTLELKPGGHHIMLFDATSEIKVGDVIKVDFLINGTEEKFDFKVIDRAAQKTEPSHH
ncbi:MAG: copper chaperone PCu(A)C [Bdellovibrio sp.]|nr:copper chaperone PCu(A)C [Bdellovibrio sp.]